MRESFNVPEVSCGHCKSTIEGVLGPVPGVRQAEVDVDRKVAEVEFDETVVDRSGVVRAIEAAGYAVSG